MSEERIRLRMLAWSFAVLGLGWLVVGVMIFLFLGSLRLIAIHSVLWGVGFLVYSWALTTTADTILSGGSRVRLRSMRSTRVLVVFLIMGLLVPLVLILLGARI